MQNFVSPLGRVSAVANIPQAGTSETNRERLRRNAEMQTQTQEQVVTNVQPQTTNVPSSVNLSDFWLSPTQRDATERDATNYLHGQGIYTIQDLQNTGVNWGRVMQVAGGLGISVLAAGAVVLSGGKATPLAAPALGLGVAMIGGNPQQGGGGGYS